MAEEAFVINDKKEITRLEVLHESPYSAVYNFEGKRICRYNASQALKIKSVLGHKVPIIYIQYAPFTARVTAETALVAIDPCVMETSLDFILKSGIGIHPDAVKTAETLIKASKYTVDSDRSQLFLRTSCSTDDNCLLRLDVVIYGRIPYYIGMDEPIFYLSSSLSETGKTEFTVVSRKCLKSSMDDTVKFIKRIQQREKVNNVRYQLEGNMERMNDTSTIIKICDNALKMLSILTGKSVCHTQMEVEKC